MTPEYTRDYANSLILKPVCYYVTGAYGKYYKIHIKIALFFLLLTICALGQRNYA